MATSYQDTALFKAEDNDTEGHANDNMDDYVNHTEDHSANPGDVLAVDPAIAARADLAAIINECDKFQRYNNHKQTVGVAVSVCVLTDLD